jgi:hypothetical protein
VPAQFALTLFVSAGQLFLVQPMVGKMVLPLVGGSPAVWNTCMVVFQALLLVGYLYAHKLSGLPDRRRQVAIHLTVLGVAVLTLGAAVLFTDAGSAVPVLSSLAPEGNRLPILNVVGMLLVAVGVPFFAVSTTAPLLQRWFAVTGHPAARDPYFLYAASNAGSLLSLLGYPLVTEPLLRVAEQTWVFAGGFVLLWGLSLLCGRAMLNPLRPPSLMETTDTPPPVTAIPVSRKLKWLTLAFVPSSLMLGVTTHMTTDIGSIPLLWVLPLGLYLLTFIVAYARGSNRLLPALRLVAPVTTLLLVFTVTSGLALSVFVHILLHLAAFFALALLMHTELARLRPDPRHLTTYFLWVSLGGVAGGVVNGLLAPVLFPQVFEYSLAIVAGCLLLPKAGEKGEAAAEADPRAGLRLMVDLMVPFVMVCVCVGLKVFDRTPAGPQFYSWAAGGLKKAAAFSGLSLSVAPQTVGQFAVFAPACLISFFFVDRPLRFGLAVAAILFVHHFTASVNKDIRTTTRTYFGVMQVRDETTPVRAAGGLTNTKSRVLTHGTTIHGRQFRDNVPGYPNVQHEPLTYYHRTGPVGDLFRDAAERSPTPRVGIVGLGTGSVAAYAQSGQTFTYYEIDREVVRLVEDDTHFTFLKDARDRGAVVEHVLGDARLTLARHTDRKYDLLLLDAFSSDAIPVHLLTVEAVRMYADRVSDGGVLAVHVSNRYLQLEPVVAAVAKECGLTCRVRTDVCEEETAAGLIPLPGIPPGRTSCTWIVLAKDVARLTPSFTAGSDDPKAAVLGGGAFASDPLWQPLVPTPGVDAWTDDFANVPQVIRSPEFQRFRRLLGFDTPITK